MSYIYNMTDTWDNAGTTYTAIKMDVTDTASAAASLLLDLLISSTSKFKIAKNGCVTIATGTITTSAPIFDLSQTWNAGAVAFTGLKLNITKTAADGASKVFDFQIGGNSFFYNDSTDGSVIINQLTSAITGNALAVQYNGNTQITLGHGAGASTGVLGINNSATNFAVSMNTARAWINFGGGAAYFGDEASAIMAIRNGATAHTLRVYGTADSGLALPTNFERIAITASAITVETGGTGADDIDLALTPAGAGLLKFGSHAAIGTETVTGYITIKDAGGNSRKLAVVSS